MINFLSSLQNDSSADISINNDYYYIGSYNALVSSKSIWHKGATYMTAQRSNETNNAPAILKWKNGNLDYANIGVIDNQDLLEHPHPAILIINDFIYIFQTNGHGDNIKIWKSNVSESVTDGFTLHHTIIGKFGYCNPRLLSDGRLIILSRYTSSASSIDRSLVILISDFNDITSWTERRLTDVGTASVTNNWHYPSLPFQYETNNWQYIGASIRRQPEGNWWGQAIFKTQDFITYYSLDESFSKNIVLNGVLTPLEIENNCMLIGSVNDRTKDYKPLEYIVVNDTVYSYYFDENLSSYFFRKTDGLGNSVTSIAPNSLSTGFRIIYNGNNLVLRRSSEIFACDFNFENIRRVFEIEQNQYNNSGLLLPTNLDEINGFYMFGGYIPSFNNDVTGIFPYYITDLKFN